MKVKDQLAEILDVEMTTDDEVRLLVRQRMKDFKISQLEIADYLGVTNVTISQWLLGKTNINSSTLFGIMDYLNLTIIKAEEI